MKSTFLLLVKNIHLNKISTKCSALNLGLGKEPNIQSIFIKKNHSGAASLIPHFDNNEQVIKDSIEIVSSRIFSDLAISKYRHSITCKIDVEGKEMDVIETLVESEIFSLIDEVFYEVNENWLNPLKLETILKSKGFKTFKKIGNGEVHYDVFATR